MPICTKTITQETIDIAVQEASERPAFAKEYENMTAEEFREFIEGKLVERMKHPIDVGVLQDIQNENPRYGKEPVTIVDGFIRGGKPYIMGIKKYHKNAEEFPAATLGLDQGSIEKLLRDSIEAIGSNSDIQVGKRVNWSKYKDLGQKIHGDQIKMVELMDTLEEMEGKQTDPKHLEYLKSLIESMDSRFFTNMNTYIKEGAARTQGVITGTKLGIEVSKRKNIASNKQTAAEVYAHEVIHAYTRFAIKMARDGDEKLGVVVRQLEHTMESALDRTRWQDLLGDIAEEDATAAEKANAKEMFEYMFHSEFAEDEFMAHVLTNKIVVDHMKKVPIKEEAEAKNIWEKVKNMFGVIADVLMGDYKFKDKGKNVHEVTVELAGELAKANNKAEVAAEYKESLLDKLRDKFNDLDEEVSARIGEGIDRLLPEGKKLGPVPEGRLARGAWMAKALTKAVMDPKYRKAIMSYLDMLNIVDQRGDIASILRDFADADDTAKAVDWIALASDKIDQAKMNVLTTVKSIVKDGFTRPLTTEEEELVTLVLIDTDVQSLNYNTEYDNKKLRGLLSDEAKLDRELNKAKSTLYNMDRKHYNWHVNQASGLGYYQATGKASVAQMLNSSNIARGYGSAEYKRPWIKRAGDLERAIDRVATLTALKYTDKNSKKRVAELMVTEFRGVKNVLKTATALKEQSETELFEGEKQHMIKGYTKELFDDQITIEVVPVSKHKEMLDKGFTRVKELEGHSAVRSSKFALYVSKNYGNQDWYRTATRLTKQHTKGMSLEDVVSAEEGTYNKKKVAIHKNRLDTERYKLVKKMLDGELDVSTVETGMLPLLDGDGNVTSYRFVMDKESKKGLLKQDTRVSEVLGATRGMILDKSKSIEHNNKVLNMIKADAEENYVPGDMLGKDGSRYILITEDTTDPDMLDLWKVLPKEFKKEAMRSDENGLPVRKDLMIAYFGYRHASLSNIPWIKDYMPSIIKNGIKIAETIWMEFIKIVKVDILLKMPFVLVQNVISNILYAINTGSGPLEVFSMYKESTRSARHYLRGHREAVKIGEKIAAGTASAKDKERLKLIEKQLKGNSIHELYELGLYQAIVEDASQEELSSTNKLKKTLKEKIEGMPGWFKQGLQMAYITEETGYYKFAQEVLQMSDLVARDIENKKMKKVAALQKSGKKPLPRWYIKQLEDVDAMMSKKPVPVWYLRLKQNKEVMKSRSRKMGVEERSYFQEVADMQRKNTILNAFVNYNKPSGPKEEYLNKMGAIMFTKYAKRIQTVIATSGTRYPLKTIGMFLTDSYMIDMDMIQDQSVFSRSWYNMTPQWPWERVLDVAVPAIVQDTTYRIY